MPMIIISNSMCISGTIGNAMDDHIGDGLMVDLVGVDYNGGSSWKSRGNNLAANVSTSVYYSKCEHAFEFAVAKGATITMPLPRSQDGYKQITYVMWLKVGSPIRHPILILGQWNELNNHALALQSNCIQYGNDSTRDHMNTGFQLVQRNKWVQVVGVWDDSSGNRSSTIYIDATQGASLIQEELVPHQQGKKHELIFGAKYNGDYNGTDSIMISDVRIYNRCLSSMEVTIIHAAGRTSLPQGMYLNTYVYTNMYHPGT